MTEKKILELPILPLRNTVIFPSGITPLTVGRPLSLAAAEAALSTEEKLLGVMAQREDNETEPTPENLYQTGTVVVINRMMRSPGAEEVLHLIVQGQERFRVLEFTQQTPHLKARVEVLPEPIREKTPEVEALQRNIQVLVQNAPHLLDRGRLFQAGVIAADDKFGLRVVLMGAVVCHQAVTTEMEVSVALDRYDRVRFDRRIDGDFRHCL